MTLSSLICVNTICANMYINMYLSFFVVILDSFAVILHSTSQDHSMSLWCMIPCLITEANRFLEYSLVELSAFTDDCSNASQAHDCWVEPCVYMQGSWVRQEKPDSCRSAVNSLLHVQSLDPKAGVKTLLDQEVCSYDVFVWLLEETFAVLNPEDKLICFVLNVCQQFTAYV